MTIIMMGAMIPNVFGQTESNNILDSECKKLEPVNYEVGINVATIGEIDTKTGSYELIFWLSLVSDKIDFTKCPPPAQWDFTNGYVKSMSGEVTEPHFHKVLIHGIFFDEFDFRDYPFEQINLSIHIEPYYPLTSKNISFSINEEFSGLTIASGHVPGYDVGEIKMELSETQLAWGNFPHLNIVVPLSNDSGMVFMKKIFPAMILAGFGYATFFMSPKILQDRNAIIGTSLVGAIFFHAVFLLGELPPIGYLTIADKVMITIYSIFSFSLLSVLLQQKYLNALNHSDKNYAITTAKNLDMKLIKLAPIFAIMIFLGLFLF
ncbi:MAG: hypothetical protein HN384_04900 [Nitrosopumilus sp.]|nr:hypothetical protein [Nitrosopumilus sp.]